MRCVFVGVKLDRGALTQISTELGRTSRVRYRCPLTRWTWLRAAELPTVHPAVAMAVFWRERERERAPRINIISVVHQLIAASSLVDLLVFSRACVRRCRDPLISFPANNQRLRWNPDSEV